jgi:voltage-gated sodium channel
VSFLAEELRDHPVFVNTMTSVILLAGACVGAQTELNVPQMPSPNIPALDALDSVILAFFTVEVFVKVVAEGRYPLHYFADAWNCFDFFIVFACYVFMAPALQSMASMVAMLRLFRLLRVLKLVKAFPELRIIIEALIAGVSSITFVIIILFIFYYIYAIIGMMLFKANDPSAFGNLQQALITLFREATFDAWYDHM